ncbi:MAG: diguanylate cyclase [Cyanobacteriota bacterium]
MEERFLATGSDGKALGRKIGQQMQRLIFSTSAATSLVRSRSRPGVACFPIHGNTGEAVMQAADGALYEAKAQGRDRVSVCC